MLSSGPELEVNSSPASGVPLRCASDAAMITSSRSPGVTTSAPEVSRCAMLGTVRAVTTVPVTRRVAASPRLTTSAFRARATSRVRNSLSAAFSAITPSSGNSPDASTLLRARNSASSPPKSSSLGAKFST